MRILLVEDHDRIVELLRDAFSGPLIELVVAQSRDAALEQIAEGSFDLAILDMKIPATDTSGDTEMNHGMDVCDRLQAEYPGIPIRVFSAFGISEALGERLEDSEKHDVFGQEAIPMLRQIKKDRISEFTEQILGLAQELEDLETGVELSWEGKARELSDAERRVLKIFARRRNGVLIHAWVMKEGHSGAKTLKIEVEASNREITAVVLAKLDLLPEIEDEHRRYEDLVAPLLPPGAFAGSAGLVVAGAAGNAGAFFSLAREDHRSLFSVLRDDPGEAASVIRLLRERVEPWQRQPGGQQISVSDLRGRLINADDFQSIKHELSDELLERVEGRLVNVHWCPGHCDLHGENLLVNEAGHPVLIDYARVDRCTSCLDAITLELSPVLHPDAKLALAGWPSEEQAKQWSSLDAYLEGCPIEDFVRACREWAEATARGRGELLATLYSYAARQLKFPDVDKSLAAAYATGALEQLEQ